MTRLILSFAVCFALWQCNTPPPTTQTPVAENKVDTMLSVPVYESYSELAPIFEMDNDTTYVINFWATWCKPCVEELPYFEEIHTAFAEKPVKVILVSLDFKKYIDKKLIPFIKDRNLQSKVVALVDPDANSWISAVEESWDGAIPVTVIYKGKQRKFVSGQFANHEELETLVKSFL